MKANAKVGSYFSIFYIVQDHWPKEPSKSISYVLDRTVFPIGNQVHSFEMLLALALQNNLQFWSTGLPAIASNQNDKEKHSEVMSYRLYDSNKIP